MNSDLKVLISSEELQKRIKELGEEISRDFQGEEITIVCILKGGVMFFVDLAKNLTCPSVKYDFLDVSSYFEGTESTGAIKFNKDIDEPVTGKNVIIVEDIIDSGRSLAYVVRHLMAQKPKALKVCTLLDKAERREVFEVVPEYVGFSIPNKFIVGYGLDLDERYRNLDHIAYFEEN